MQTQRRIKALHTVFDPTPDVWAAVASERSRIAGEGNGVAWLRSGVFVATGASSSPPSYPSATVTHGRRCGSWAMLRLGVVLVLLGVAKDEGYFTGLTSPRTPFGVFVTRYDVSDSMAK